MSQNLKGVDIYDCPFFELTTNGKLRFVSGAYYDRTPDSFKTIDEIYNLTRYCMWIIKKKDALEVSKYAALVYMNQLHEKLHNIEGAYRKVLRSQQDKQRESIRTAADKSGKRHI